MKYINRFGSTFTIAERNINNILEMTIFANFILF